MVLFDKPCFIVRGAVGYFREHMSIGDYLVEAGAAEMKWAGRGAELLGLTGVCEIAAFETLCRGLHPSTGERLTVRDKGSQRRVCYFGQLSPPKDVSIAHLVGGDTRIRTWWEEAVRDTLAEIESLVATRVRRSGAQEDRLTGHMVAAVVTHEASRALDPQLHTHVCLLNVTFDPVEQRWKGVQPSGIYRHPGYLREVCYARLAARLREAGYELEPLRGVGFSIKGIPPELRERFSRRRQEILAAAEAIGARSQAALQAIASNTRAAKEHTSDAELRTQWVERAGELLSDVHATIRSTNGIPKHRPRSTARDLLHAAEAHLFERRSVVDQPTLLREALAPGLGDASVSELKQALEARLREGALVRVNGEIASRDTLHAENEFVRWAQEHLRTCPRLGTGPLPSSLASDQHWVVSTILSSISRVTVLQGDAGTGKTTCLRTIAGGIEHAGGRVFGCAPSSSAADVLRRELTPDADTLQQLLLNADLQRAARGRTIIVDEAGLVFVRQMRDLCRLADHNDNRLLLVGDIKQHNSIEAGDALRCLQTFAEVPTARLTQIRRQRDLALRRAVELLAQGEARRAFDEFSRLGCVHESRSERQLFHAAAQDYVNTLRSGRTCLAVSPVWSEIHAFTETVRREMKSHRLLSTNERVVSTVASLQWTRAQLRRLDNFQPGDALTFHRTSGKFARHETVIVERRDHAHLLVRTSGGDTVALDPLRTSGFDAGRMRDIQVATGDRLLLRSNLKPAHLKNGDLVEVTGFAADGAIILRDGRHIPPGFRQFTHGYATTSHAAQGKTVDRGLLLMANAGIAAGNLQQAYVSNSRFREDQMIYTTDAARARDAMERPADRKLARELVDTPRAASFRQSFLHALYRLGRIVTGREQLLGPWSVGPTSPRATVGRN